MTKRGLWTLQSKAVLNYRFQMSSFSLNPQWPSRRSIGVYCSQLLVWAILQGVKETCQRPAPRRLPCAAPSRSCLPNADSGHTLSRLRLVRELRAVISVPQVEGSRELLFQRASFLIDLPRRTFVLFRKVSKCARALRSLRFRLCQRVLFCSCFCCCCF